MSMFTKFTNGKYIFGLRKSCQDHDLETVVSKFPTLSRHETPVFSDEPRIHRDDARR
jgi:hypothetical protein